MNCIYAEETVAEARKKQLSVVNSNVTRVTIWHTHRRLTNGGTIAQRDVNASSTQARKLINIHAIYKLLFYTFFGIVVNTSDSAV